MYHSARRNIKHSRPSILAKRITFFYFEVVEYTKGNQRNLIGSWYNRKETLMGRVKSNQKSYYLILYQWGKELKNITTATILGSFLKATLEKRECKGVELKMTRYEISFRWKHPRFLVEDAIAGFPYVDGKSKRPFVYFFA